MTIVQLEGSRLAEEFNLQFTRLNLGTILNSGEKLHAMVGDLRDVCFLEDGIGQHPFFERTRIPTRRFAKEQVAAQLLAQIFSLEESSEYARTRHFDLQKAFKTYARLDETHRNIINKTESLLNLLQSAFEEVRVLRNRAITVSTVLLAWEMNVADMEDARKLARFIDGFVCRLKWQVDKGLDADQEYRYLIDFQRHLTQASVEKPAVKARADTLKEEYQRWLTEENYRGDDEYVEETGEDPNQACRQGRSSPS